MSGYSSPIIYTLENSYFTFFSIRTKGGQSLGLVSHFDITISTSISIRKVRNTCVSEPGYIRISTSISISISISIYKEWNFFYFLMLMLMLMLVLMLM